MANPKTSVFAPDIVTVMLIERHVPDAYYQTRSGLWVSEKYRDLVVVKAGPTKAGAKFSLKPRPLGREALDKEIEGELEEMLGKSGHLFTETQVCAIVAHLISGQPKGESGPLLNNGYANLFYLASCVVSVDWDSDYRKWHVNAWPRDGCRWFAGPQVFSPSN